MRAVLSGCAVRGKPILLSSFFVESVEAVPGFDGATWTQQSELIATDGSDDDDFGFSVSLSGKRALIGARDADVQGVPTGASYIFGQ